MMFKLPCSFLARFIVGACLSLSASATVVRFDIDFGGTPHGSIYLDLFDYSNEPPLVPALNTVNNFLKYVDNAGDRRYDGTLIHRNEPIDPQNPSLGSFVIQGGGYRYDPALGPFPRDDLGNETAPHIPTYPVIANEFDASRSNVRGTIAMARTDLVDSATSEWFINMQDNSANLDNQNGGFTVFGRVLGHGMTLMEEIEALNNVHYFLVPWFGQLPVIGNINVITEASHITLARVEVNPPGVLSPDLLSVDFGLVDIAGPSSTITVTLQNIGGQDIVIGAIGGAGGIGGTDPLVAPFSFTPGGDTCSGQTLVSRATCTVDITFSPTTTGDFLDSFDIPSNDAKQPNLVVNIKGTGIVVPALLDVTPTALDFGAVGTGQPAEIPVTVRNLGTQPLQLLSQQLSGTDSSEFSIVNNTCNTAVLGSGQTCDLSVRLLSFSLGNLSAALDVLADPGGQAAQINMSANITLIQPVLRAPASITVPDVRFDLSGTATFVIGNEGVDDLFISAINVQGTDASLFSVVSSDCIDVAVAPGASCSGQISFNPAVKGRFNAILSVQSNDPASPATDIAVVATASQDADGVPDFIEEAGPGNGDANQDGIADALQENVASFLDNNGRYVTLETGAGLALTNVRAIQNPSPATTPSFESGSIAFDQGFFAFDVENVPAGGRAQVIMYMPSNYQANRYFKFGRRPLEPEFFFPEHWYEFTPYDPATGIGVEFFPGRIILHLVDGGLGDNDQDGTNGRIVDPGGPAVLTISESGASGGGGCSILPQSRQAPGRNATSLDFIILLAGLVLLRFYGSGRTRPESV